MRHLSSQFEIKIVVYTDGSRDDYYRSGSGIYIKFQDHILRIQRRNPDGCSVFRSDLIVIDEALGSLASLLNKKEIWILSEGRSATQHLYNWQSVRYNAGVSILTKLKRLSTSHQIHLQWILSHIDLEGNEIADTKVGACEAQSRHPPSSFWRFSLELNTRIRRLGLTPQSPIDINVLVLEALAHGFTRQDQTLLARFRSGHIKSMKFSEGRKGFEMCTNCSSEPATPAHILECLGLIIIKQDLTDVPLLVLDFLKVYDVMDLV
ncbi:RNase H domain-containing protein [Trichonephila clavipes]|nr:RNase H domain-containing protein [Trichonephila clavipes]